MQGKQLREDFLFEANDCSDGVQRRTSCTCDDEGTVMIRQEAIVAYFIIQPQVFLGINNTSK
jgi:hypothetical protein